MIKVGIISPWPPQSSGIASYTFDLVRGLSEMKDLQVTVVTNCDQPMECQGVDIATIASEEESTALAKIPLEIEEKLETQDILIYHIGNHFLYHGYMLELLKKHPGICHMHDIVIQNMIAAAAIGEGGIEGYLGVLKKRYGAGIANKAKELRKVGVSLWETELSDDMPLFEEVLELSLGAIVHSQFAQNKIAAQLPRLFIHKVNQIYKEITPDRQNPSNEGPVHIGIFGGVHTNRLVNVILEVLGSETLQKENFKLHIVGSVAPECQYLTELPGQYGIKEKVVFHGRVDDAKFTQMLGVMNFCVCLRHPTKGETSAVVMKSMQMGIPVIVNDVGWYSELPPFVDKLPVQNMQKYLQALIGRYLFDTDYAQKKRERFIQFARQSLVFNDMIELYRRIIVKEYRRLEARRTVMRNNVIHKPFNKMKNHMNLAAYINTPAGKQLKQKFYSLLDRTPGPGQAQGKKLKQNKKPHPKTGNKAG